jgi:2',3'-cyclic-nucleotide 2'-phosphodiesterase (5'-nucleotidase family)
MTIVQKKLLLFSLSIWLFSCQTFYQPQSVQYKDYRVTQANKQDENINAALKPYADSVNKSMNDIIAVAEEELVKRQPEGSLGNIMADGMLAIAKEKYNQTIDASFINSGGIRLQAIPAGNITRGKIFELAPFDNIIVLLKIDGKTFQQFLNHISGRGGWPTAGMTWQIKNKEAVNVLIGGSPINETSTYTIALVDYVANGGDDCEMLKTIPQINNGLLFRDAILNYFSSLTKKGKKIPAIIEKRVSNAN